MCAVSISLQPEDKGQGDTFPRLFPYRCLLPRLLLLPLLQCRTISLLARWKF